ncbi:hypothetical protein D8S78_00360 [Natrialba swarupiae]|nr:hypothetical protein [Natrialba swarupiae]
MDRSRRGEALRNRPQCDSKEKDRQRKDVGFRSGPRNEHGENEVQEADKHERDGVYRGKLLSHVRSIAQRGQIRSVRDRRCGPVPGLNDGEGESVPELDRWLGWTDADGDATVRTSTSERPTRGPVRCSPRVGAG